jgi:hypothetical protein
LNSGDLQTEHKKKSRLFYLVLVAAVLLIAVIVGVVIFEFFNIGNTRYGPGPVEIEVTTDKSFYLQGEEVNFTITVNNPQDWPVPHPLQISYQIERNDKFVDGVTIMVTPAGSPTFPAHSRTLYDTYVWDQKTGPGSKRTQVPLGNYTFSVSFGRPVDYGSGGNCTFEIRPNPQS